MNGKGDRNRTTDWEKFYDGYNKVFRPKEPFYKDIKKYESRFRNKDIEKTPFKADPIKHDIRRVL
jgi:hypothetical protein